MADNLIAPRLLEHLSGKPVCVHASMRSFGALRTTSQIVVDQLLKAGCTVIVPTFTYAMEQPPPVLMRPPARNGWSDTDSLPEPHGCFFSPHSNDLSLAAMGAFPAAILAMKDRVRGNHPLNSFTAVGPAAKNIIETQSAENVYGPLKMLCDLRGAILLIGTSYTSLTLLHLAESDAGRKLFRRWGRNENRELVECSTGGCSNGFDQFESVLVSIDEYVGESRWRYLDANETRQAATTSIKHQSLSTHCGRKGCQRCNHAALGGPIL